MSTMSRFIRLSSFGDGDNAEMRFTKGASSPELIKQPVVSSLTLENAQQVFMPTSQSSMRDETPNPPRL